MNSRIYYYKSLVMSILEPCLSARYTLTLPLANAASTIEGND